MRWAIASVILVHGLIHFLGAAKGFGLAELPELAEPVSRRGAVVWLVASLALVCTAALFVRAPRLWWIVGSIAVVISQLAIVSSWGDARFGTVVNVILLGLLAYAFAAEGPFSLRAEYRRGVDERLASTPTQDAPLHQSRIEGLSESDLQELPAPVQRYVRRSGAIGQPRVAHFQAEWKGRIRGSAEEPWMTFTAVQHNFVDPPARYFSMDARRSGLPVDVLHVFADESASMRVRLLSLAPLVTASGPELTRAETVTLLNDISILAPGALMDARLQWEAMSERQARVTYTVGSNTVRAVLTFNEADELVDFVSDDRLAASADGSSFTPQRWSTPLRDYQSFSRLRLASRGEGRWHPVDASDFAYIELRLVEVEMNPGGRRVTRPQ